MSAHGARKGLSDTALRTADSGYLTRRLVDVSQELIIREPDCCCGHDHADGEIPGMYVHAFMDGNEEIESLRDRIVGRYAAEAVYDKKGKVLVEADHMITPDRADAIIEKGVGSRNGEFPIEEVKVRTILTCESETGICAKCYGANMATGEPVQVGEAVGIIAAQSIGEPGTQLTMRTFHTGGVAGNDITQGLPRVEELFEARKPKGLAIIAEFGGEVRVEETKKKREVTITNDETGEAKTYTIPFGYSLKVRGGEPLKTGDVLEAGDELTEGSVDPHDLLRIKGAEAVQNYILREVQRAYRQQGVDINDKHIEVIVRQMMKKMRILDCGDSRYLPGTMVNTVELKKTNAALEAEGKKTVEAEKVLLGITKASLATDSFLSAASFQETTRVLTDAAIKGKVDPLQGLKENVLIGKLIPAGTGMKRYRNVEYTVDGIPEPEHVIDEETAEEFIADPTDEAVVTEAVETEEIEEVIETAEAVEPAEAVETEEVAEEV